MYQVNKGQYHFVEYKHREPERQNTKIQINYDHFPFENSNGNKFSKFMFEKINNFDFVCARKYVCGTDDE